MGDTIVIETPVATVLEVSGLQGPQGPTGPQGPAGDVSGSVAWSNVTGKPATFTPSAHASTHHTGGTDAIAPNQISAAWAEVLSSQAITADTLLSAGRNRRIGLGAYGVTANVDLPHQNNQAGDVVTLVADVIAASTLSIRRASVMSGSTPVAYHTLATLNASEQSFTFVSDGTATGWSLRAVDSHHASRVTSGTFDNARINFAAPPSIGSTTASSGAFTTLSASNKLSLPSAAAASPAAGDVYRVTNTLRYRDSTNTERLLLNATDNLANLANTATALSNLGLLGAIRDMKVVSPSSDFTATSSTTLSNVTGMSFTAAANTTYAILTNLQVNCGAGGYNCELSFPSILNNGTTASGFGVQLPGNNSVAGLATTTATTVKVSNRGTNQTTPSFSILLVRTDSTGGTANFQWAQNVSSAAASTISATSRALIVPLTT